MFTQTLVRPKSVRADGKQTNKHRVAAFYQAALANRLPVALWRQPRGRSYEAIVDLTAEPQPTTIDFHANRPMFVFSPFVKEQNSATLCLQANLHLNATGLYSYNAADYTVRQVEHHRRFMQTYQDLLKGELKARPSWYTLPFAIQRNKMATEVEFSALVKSAIDFIRAIQIRKVVVSRLMETPLPANFDPLVTFEQLCNRYPHAFVSLVAIPNVGTWMGASPELLLSLDPEQLSTMALAGTQARPTDQALDAVQWGHKEVEEQALVSDYIRGFFHKAGIPDLQEVGPETTAAGNIVHLRTTFQVKRSEDELLTLANQVLHQLHPTSAVCGMPKDKALSFILAHEQYDRSFYSGFLGPVHIGGQSNLYVNLRCMQLQKQTANLYIGAGITGESQPAAEWRETALKSETLLNVLHATTLPTTQHASLTSRHAARER